MNRRLVWLLVPALALLELGAHAYFSNRAPTIDEWKAVAPALADLRRSDELVVVAPEWAEPVARHAVGDAFFPLSHAARPDATSFSRAIEIAAHGARTKELADWQIAEERNHGDLVLRVLENPSPVKVVHSFVDRLENAEVSHGTQSCRWSTNARVSAGGLGGPPTAPSDRFECAGASWVGVTVIDDEAFRPRRCVWALPGVIVRFRDVALGERIYGYTGMPWLLTRDGYGTPIELVVRVGGETVGTAVHPDPSAWSRFEHSLGARARGKADVELEVRSSAPQNRMFCFYADTR